MNKQVLVTGGTRGVGLAIASRLMHDGYDVIASGREISEQLAGLVETEDSPGRIEFQKLDLSDHSTIRSFVNNLGDGREPLYGLVNNAAIAYDGILATIHDAQIIEMINVNVLGTILLTKYAHRKMLTRNDGRIVNISSINAFSGFNGLSVYAASKAALLGLTRSLAREAGRAGITVNAVAPGYVATDMSAGLAADKLAAVKRRSPLGRTAETEDVAAAVAFLLSAEARNITGTCLTVDAGSTA